MLIFHCTDCNEEIDRLDHENPDQAFTDLDKHIAKCPLATFTIEATTELAKDIAEVIQSVIQHDHLTLLRSYLSRSAAKQRDHNAILTRCECGKISHHFFNKVP